MSEVMRKGLRKGMSSKKGTNFQLQGGLGNQLFIYVAGIAHNLGTGQAVNFDSSLVKRGYTFHGSSISSFELSDRFSYSKLSSTRLLLSNIAQRLGVKLIYTQPDSGFDSNIGKIQMPYRVVGYFQSWKYLDQISQTFDGFDGFDGFRISRPSDWLKRETQESDSVRPISVHIRRGDYLSLKDQFGLLDSEYFENGVEYLQSRLGAAGVPGAAAGVPGAGTAAPVWIFTDSPDLCEEIARKLAARWEVRMVLPAEGSDPAESLALMANSAGLVISNSSFSWWAAAMAKAGTPVVAPEQWFLNLEPPKDIYHPSWKLVPSVWMKN